ncbi:MAG TPA: signal peptidase I [Gaiellaceae bacterium]|jgi:signal peptidase I|nr:signal peptidase I [Gaiellaceae bacterium]
MLRALSLAAVAIVAAGCGADQDTRRFRVPSSSMEPTLHCARPGLGCEADTMDVVAVHPYGSERPRRDDVVVFRTPPLARLECGAGGIYIKRVIGLPGERWSERGGYLVIDGRRLSEPYVKPDRRDARSFRGGRIPPNEFLLLGDNRAASCDSRIYGLVPRRNLIGRVFEIKRGSMRIHIR